MLEQVIKFVNKSFEKCATGKSVAHFESTLHWIKELRPEADEPILIAAYAHDIQRAFRETNTENTFKNIELNDPDLLKHHQQEGSKIICNFLESKGYDKKGIKRIGNMIAHHEEGGDEESDLIKDADSISYFYTNANKHVTETVKTLGKEKIRNKIDWMYNRITSEKAKKIAKPKYLETVNKLKTFKTVMLK
ncbi:HD domain-containing protein [Patescibacteria group bacterium]|nr:HD domain-containing protein [Patescibacteria group bacterium]MBU1015551.1 HD domain-containing protein [Patescibacteria group bacterium]MBU1685602.1 HD domain-containing protein [Patescibacteria group bacterium]MBU1938980.1 HD domain-containing protein [Patescibacteria group bacterium]